MNLKSTFKLSKSSLEIDYNDSLFFIGSCFSENISSRLIDRKFECLSNPLGIIYNPISIFKNIDIIINQKSFTKSDLFYHNEVWSSYDFHSDMSALNPIEVLNNIHSSLEQSFLSLKKAKVIFVTFGSAWVYEAQNGKLVANCHKMPNNTFTKRCLSVSEIKSKAEETISLLKAINEEVQIVFTLSPVRHLKDGFVENNLSKSVLNIAIHQIISSVKNCSYFPAYELVMDDLRDYRFYKEDLIHPNKIAVDYIFEQFTSSFLNESTLLKLRQVEKVINMLQHKVNFKDTEAYKKFKLQLLTKIDELEAQNLDFSEEKQGLLH